MKKFEQSLVDWAPEEFYPSKCVVTQEDIDLFKKCVEEIGAEWQEPKWLLTVNYG